MTTETISSTPVMADVAEFMRINMGVNPLTTYCQLTGKPIGRIYPEEVDAILLQHNDIEEAADDLFVRTLASMRPSIAWNVMKSESLAQLCEARPVETMAYLLNRLFARSDIFRTAMPARLQEMQNRINIYAWLNESFNSGEQFQALMVQLLDIDAKMNLTQQVIDLKPEQMIHDIGAAIGVFDAWYLERIKRWAWKQRNEIESRNWDKGNSMARPAFVAAFTQIKPETKAETVKREKNVRKRIVSDLLETIMQVEPEAEPIVAPVTPAKLGGATKLPSFLMKGN